MVDVRTASVPAGAPATGLEVLSLSDLRAHRPEHAFGRPLRMPCHVLMLFTVGHGRHTMDFVAYDCRPSTLLWGRPGQVHQFTGQPGLDANLLLFTPELVPPPAATADRLRALLHDPFAPANWLPTGEDEEAIITEFTQLATDHERCAAGDGVPAELLHHQLAVLLVRIAALTGPAPQVPDRLVTRLHEELAASMAATRRVEDYADRLGVSVRTLTRACLVATGRSAKQVIDDRVTLEARRLLACSDEPVAAVGRQLGFAEPTNFGRFFVRETGLTPGEFRTSLTGTHCENAVVAG
ncbi:helix-turn-helix transcriptional regulator [Planosporangium thailandense]|uniref:Helix-turn-helix transcriptional regulator n=1 Tax=Planosporangium thailandense TaxID=765197 RepID=A0ABX0XWB1_9ACTN|nr:AraC family transcriptional regulator [Planosporangium thailandense]NJC70326.1 helix-turn-helix transcriptional regulator [Planosporangium thailandense]